MSVSTTSLSESPAATAETQTAGAALPELEASVRLPVLYFYLAALGWLAVAALIEFVDYFKLAVPGFMAGSPWLTYGRLAPASVDAFLYGFGLQAGLGTLFWMSGRLGRVRLRFGGMVFLTTIFWNLGLGMGILGVLGGLTTGYPTLELPGYAASILIICYLLIGGYALVQFHDRERTDLYVSQWYLLAGLVWFAWIFIGAEGVLHWGTTNGLVELAAAWWFRHNLVLICLGSFTLAAVFYFIPQRLNLPLADRSLALFGFWSMMFIGSWGGVPPGSPVPAWMVSLSWVAALLFLVPLICIGLNLHRTLEGKYERLKTDPVLAFVSGGAACFLLYGLLDVVCSGDWLAGTTGYTIFEWGRRVLGFYGFVGLATFGAIYAIVPRLTLREWPSRRLTRIHGWGTVLGIGLLLIALGIGGLVQGASINNPNVAFLDVMKRTRGFVHFGILGSLAFTVGQAAFFLHLLWHLTQTYCPVCLPPKLRPVAAQRNTTGVKA